MMVLGLVVPLYEVVDRSRHPPKGHPGDDYTGGSKEKGLDLPAEATAGSPLLWHDAANSCCMITK